MFAKNHSPLVREIYQFSLAMGVELMLIDCSSISPALDSLVNGSSDVGWCQWVVAMSWLNASVGVR